jgi:hypothetical protein
MPGTKKIIAGIITTLLGLIVIAVLIYALLSTTGVIRNSDPNNQKLNESMNAIDKQAMDTIGADSNNNNNNNPSKIEEKGFGYWFKVGAGIGLGFVVVVGGIILLIFIAKELWEEYGPADVGI